jgi:hypothetical protein
MEKDHPFVECATFADSIKSVGWDDQAHWHFVDNTYLDDGYKKDVPTNDYNVTWAIGEMLDSIQYAKPDSNSQSGSYVSYALGDSMNLRLFIHYVGDIHQPLHAVSRYTSQYPDGDRGGNSFTLTKKDDVSNLHSLWDSVIYKYSTDLSQVNSHLFLNFFYSL